MEKLQPIIAGVKKYNFWIVLSIVCVLLLYFWWISTPIFSGPFKKNQRDIKKQFAEMKSLRGKGEYPNRKWIKTRDDERAAIDTTLAEVARDNYEEQASARKWEGFTEVRPNAALERDQLQEFWREYLPSEIENLKKIVNASVDENASGQLIWNRKNFSDIADEAKPKEVTVYEEAKREAEEKSTADDERREAEGIMKNMVWPDKSKVIAAQEIIWVYQAMLNAVAEVNKDAGDDLFKLPVRSIEELKVWSDASATPKEATKLVTRRVRKAGSKSNPNDAREGLKIPQVEGFYRVVPVRMELQLNHQYLAPLLVALANEALTCEVVDVNMTSNPGFKMKVEEEAAAPARRRRPGLGGLQGLGRPGAPAADAAPQAPTVPPGNRVVIEALFYVAKPPKKKAS